jgi:hypothetical protein
VSAKSTRGRDYPRASLGRGGTHDHDHNYSPAPCAGAEPQLAAGERGLGGPGAGAVVE